MYPRLKLLQKLMAEDGVIFISIDEIEHRYLELLMDEIFGSVNRIDTFVWQNNYGGGAKSNYVVHLHEYILCFAKNISQVQKLELPPDESILKYYKYLSDFTRVMIDLGNSCEHLSADEAATTIAQFANIMGTSQSQFSNIGSTLVDLGNNFATTEKPIMEMAHRMAGAGKQVGLTEAQVLGFAAVLSSVGI